MLCSYCSKDTTTPIIQGNRVLCPPCDQIINPPVFLLTRLWTTTSLYNPISKHYMPGGIRTLEACGFKLYNRKIFFNKTVSPVYQEILVFRYFGNVACNLIEDYNWPLHKIKCHAVNCP